MQKIILCLGVFAVLSACSTVPPTADAQGRRPRLSFEAARERCGASVAESPQVKSCMRAQGWAYRHPWE